MMIIKLKSPTIHAIRILKYMGQLDGQEVPVSSEISRDICVTQSYFMRISKDLRKARLLDTTQGRMGGFQLCRSLEEISLYDVVEAMQGKEDFLECQVPEALYRIVEDINNSIAESLKQISLGSL